MINKATLRKLCSFTEILASYFTVIGFIALEMVPEITTRRHATAWRREPEASRRVRL